MNAVQDDDAHGWQYSADAWMATVESDIHRTLLLDPLLIELVQDVSGLDIADVGCGEGRFCRILASMGANCTGIDPTPALVQRARELGGAVYLQEGAEKISLPSNSQDLVLSYLSLIDIEDFRTAIGEMVRIARPKSRLLIALIHPMASAWPCWFHDDSGNRLYWRIDRYFEERGELAEWSGMRVTNYHRPLQAYFAAFLEAGCTLSRFIEPTPTPEAIEKDPRIAKQLRVPNFLVMEFVTK